MLKSTDAVLVGTSIVLAVSTIVSVALQLDRQYKTTGHLNASKCESDYRNFLPQLCND
jgi:hypothetical protein